jgi:ATP synthase protein I
MSKINHAARNDAWSAESADDVSKPLTQAQAQVVKRQNPVISPWAVLAGQTAGGFLVALVAWWVTGNSVVGRSALYGAAAVVIPGALFARGVMSRISLINPAAAATGFFLWEMVKIVLVLAMLFAAPKLVKDLSWPAMLVGLIVTMKVVWLVLWLEVKAQRKSKKLSVVQ